MAINVLTVIAIISLITFYACAIDVPPINCGTTNFTAGLITKGTAAARGEWPFLAALFYAEEKLFFCGGSLISAKHVLTGTQSICSFCVAEFTLTKLTFQLPIVFGTRVPSGGVFLLILLYYWELMT